MCERAVMETIAPATDDGSDPTSRTKTIVIGGVPVALGAMCPRCGLQTRLELGPTPFCQICGRAGETLQDGDCSSELNHRLGACGVAGT
jgi:hypothetical protein